MFLLKAPSLKKKAWVHPLESLLFIRQYYFSKEAVVRYTVSKACFSLFNHTIRLKLLLFLDA